jgi:hypothetical protein
MERNVIEIRENCLRPFMAGWEQPSPEEIREVLRRAELTGSAAAKLVGISESRTIRRWTGGQSPIPYAAWALLCETAGLGAIWKSAGESEESLRYINK